MRVLIVSLNSVSDLVKQASILKSIRELHSQDYIHLVTSASGHFLSFILNVHVDELTAVGDFKVNNDRFDYVYDLSHSKEGSAFAKSIRATEILSLTDILSSAAPNSWAHYFQTHFLKDTNSPFLYSEILASVLDMPYTPDTRSHKTKGKDLVLVVPAGGVNWSFYRTLAYEMVQVFTDYNLRVVVSHKDLAKARAYFSELRIQGLNIQKIPEFFEHVACIVSITSTLQEIAQIMGVPYVTVSDESYFSSFEIVNSVWKNLSKEKSKLCDKREFRRLVWQMNINNADMGSEIVEFARRISSESLLQLREETADYGRALADIRVEIPARAWFGDAIARDQIWNNLRRVVGKVTKIDIQDGYLSELAFVLEQEPTGDLRLFQNLLTAISGIQGILIQRKALVECLIQISMDGGYNGTELRAPSRTGRSQNSAVSKTAS